MMLSVKPENVDRVVELFSLYDAPATPVGRVIKDKVVRLFFNGTKVFEVELDFLTKGPEYCRPYKIPSYAREEKMPPEPKSTKEYNSIMLRLLSSPNIACKDWVIRQYDHEVRAATAIKPLQGHIGTHGDAVVMKPLEGRECGLALAIGHNPRVSKLNPFIGGQIIIDELCRNLLAVGAQPHTYTNCLNFGNPENPERLGEFREVVRGMSHVSKKLGIPTPAGNVSFYNESALGTVLPTATVVGAGIVEDIRYCATTDFKQAGTHVYLLAGRGELTLGGSEYLRIRGGKSSKVTPPDCDTMKICIKTIPALIRNRIVISCHDISDGGLATTVAEMCIGGGIGCELDMASPENIRADFRLFSEAPTRWLVEVARKKEKQFLSSLKTMRLSVVRLGTVGRERLSIRDGSRKLIDLPVSKVHKAWSRPLWDAMG
jgi:phosphoribosylformylglycinamidine synthase